MRQLGEDYQTKSEDVKNRTVVLQSLAEDSQQSWAEVPAAELQRWVYEVPFNY